MISNFRRNSSDSIEVKNFSSSLSVQRVSVSANNLFNNSTSDSDLDIVILHVPANSKARITYSVLFVIYEEYKEY